MQVLLNNEKMTNGLQKIKNNNFDSLSGFYIAFLDTPLFLFNFFNHTT